MTLDPGSAAIIQLAWARHLGLDDGAFAASLTSGERLVRADDAAGTVEFVRLFGSSALVGPQWVIDAAAGIPDEEMAQHVTLLTLTRSHGGHGLGAAALFFADDLPLRQPSEELTVSHGNPEAIELEGLCPPDDVNEVHLSELGHRYTILHEVDGRRFPVACGAYGEWEGLLAQMGVLVDPEWRRRGLGSVAASIAAHAALAAGLTVQWRAEVSNTGAVALARQLGLSTGGIQTSVHLG
ncbi:GNAT family N-acetyltransferase [Pseudarthrobacter raffinosi]|uniref:GNAT family N-acetyltransferase n=1 Tax=Pseudarthrobacter raffinosi TaxID=2953651 RepID=UPI00208F4A6F|nr:MULTISPECIES: GNAT family N-acetyltransferase [unclassified Pseudarthrobacter]MCO4236110.1 GNAT family N-acetyltransferase [Pseudarthrobacter sp. MDT3-28]MCO4250573.1 GNAT family N-acetyltransferase [Pseudarthrobacter sp. MDT3-9]MCO4262711.1 GNAT family N-acetyltransferase [Pseudarthrobacter sp. MDT3-26]